MNALKSVARTQRVKLRPYIKQCCHLCTTPSRPIICVAAFPRIQFVTRIDEICRRINEGYYVIKPPEDAAESLQRCIVDNYHWTVFCQIPKAAGTSWAKMINHLVQSELGKRTEWFSQHPSSSLLPFTGARYR